MLILVSIRGGNMERFDLKWNYTNKIVNDLMLINKSKEIVDLLELPISIEEELKKEVIAKRVHYSTKIEGNTLNLKEVKRVIENNDISHERNTLEVRNYYKALLFLNDEAERNNKISKELILKVHNLVSGKNIGYKSDFREGQNSVIDTLSNTIVYLPPEAKDVDSLINQMIEEFNSNMDIPIPIKTGIFAYEFVTIHPFWDGNGRCSRLLATYILKAYGYDLNGFYVMEEFYDRKLDDYYNSLQMDLHHNFYFGRNSADITEWLEYFVGIMASTFDMVGEKVKSIYEESKDNISIIDALDKRERWVANYIYNNGKIKAKDIATHFKINLDTANNWVKKWIENDFLLKVDNDKVRNVDYTLTEKYSLELSKKYLK